MKKDLELRINALREENRLLEKEILNKKNRLASIDKNIEDAKKTLERLEKEIMEKRELLDSLINANADREEITRLEEEIERLEKLKSSYRIESESLDYSIEDSISELEITRNQIEVKNLELNDLNEKINSLSSVDMADEEIASTEEPEFVEEKAIEEEPVKEEVIKENPTDELIPPEYVEVDGRKVKMALKVKYEDSILFIQYQLGTVNRIAVWNYGAEKYPVYEDEVKVTQKERLFAIRGVLELLKMKNIKLDFDGVYDDNTTLPLHTDDISVLIQSDNHMKGVIDGKKFVWYPQEYPFSAIYVESFDMDIDVSLYNKEYVKFDSSKVRKLLAKNGFHNTETYYKDLLKRVDISHFFLSKI